MQVKKDVTIYTSQQQVVTPFREGARALAAPTPTDTSVVDLYLSGNCASGMLVEVGGTLLIDTGTSATQAVRIGAFGDFKVGTSPTVPGGLMVLMASTVVPSELTMKVKSLEGRFLVTGPVVLEGSAVGDNVVTLFGNFTFSGEDVAGVVCVV